MTAHSAHSHKPNHPPHPTTLSSTPLSLSPHHLPHPNRVLPPLLWGGFLEHLGRCIYGGIVDDPSHPSPKHLLVAQEDGKKLGFRKDVLGLFGAKGELATPIVRWPGGNYVSNYHWEDAIGPIGERRKRADLAWGGVESNLFGTDEYVVWCRTADVEPYICLNMGTGTYEEALAWLEYCNGTKDTYWANLRRKNTGKDEAYAIRYWGLGNEMYGVWQVGRLSAADYAKKAIMWAHGLRLVDPNIELVSCGETGSTDWDREVLQAVAGLVELHSIHSYTMNGFADAANYDKTMSNYETNVFGPASAEQNIKICQSLIDVASLPAATSGKAFKPIRIAFDEWNVWDPAKGRPDNGLEQVYDYTDMLGLVAWCNVLVRRSDELAMACLAQSVNVISPILTKPDGILHQTLFYPLQLFGNYMNNGHLMQLNPLPDRYIGPTFPPWIQNLNLQPAYIDTCAVLVTKQEGGTSIRLSILNRHPSVNWEAGINLQAFRVKQVEVHEMYSDDLDAANTFEQPDKVVPSHKKLSASEWADQAGKYVVRKHSWAFFIIDGDVV